MTFKHVTPRDTKEVRIPRLIQFCSVDPNRLVKNSDQSRSVLERTKLLISVLQVLQRTVLFSQYCTDFDANWTTLITHQVRTVRFAILHYQHDCTNFDVNQITPTTHPNDFDLCPHRMPASSFRDKMSISTCTHCAVTRLCPCCIYKWITKIYWFSKAPIRLDYFLQCLNCIFFFLVRIPHVKDW